MNGQEKDDEIANGLYSAIYWEYDSRLGRRWNIDPKPNPSISSYACYANNPIMFSDPLGDTLRAGDGKSAKHILGIIQSTFSGDKLKGVRDLFKVGSDGKTFESINNKDFNNATKDLSNDEKALARGYFSVVNMNEVHTVHAAFRKDIVTTSLGTMPATDIDDLTGGGFNLPQGVGKGSLTVIVLDSKQNINDFKYSTGSNASRKSTPGELLAHELLGHGVGASLGSVTSDHNDALQMSNLYWRVKGVGIYRDGTSHGTLNKLTDKQINAIPIHFSKNVYGHGIYKK